MPIKLKGRIAELLEEQKAEKDFEEHRRRLEAAHAEGRRRDEAERRERQQRESEAFAAFAKTVTWRPTGINVLARAVDLHHTILQREVDADPNAPSHVELGGRKYYNPDHLAAWWNAKAAGLFDEPRLLRLVPAQQLTPEHLKLVADHKKRRRSVHGRQTAPPSIARDSDDQDPIDVGGEPPPDDGIDSPN